MPENDTRSVRFPRFAEENFQKNLELADRVREVAEGKGITPGQLALAWLLVQGMTSSPSQEPSAVSTSKTMLAPPM